MADKRQKKLQQQQRLRIQKQRQIMQDHKNKFMPLVKFLKKQGLPFKYARVGQNRVEYFRYDDFNKIKQLKKDKIEANATIKQLLLETQNSQNLIYFRRPTQSKSLKYPHTLQPAHPSDPQSKFCSFKFDTTISRKGLMIGLIVGILALVLFPVWPFAVKYGIWLLSLYLLVFLIGLLGLRLLIYVVCVIAGFNVWLFPNLLGDYGFFESFKPVMYAQRWEMSKINILIRLTAVSLVGYYGYMLYMDPTFLQSHYETTKSTINDVHDWGVSKIKNQYKVSQRSITDLKDILNDTADVSDENDGHEYGYEHQYNQVNEDSQQRENNQNQVKIDQKQDKVETQSQF